MPKRKCKQCGEYADRDSGVLTPVAWFCSLGCTSSFAMTKAQRERERKLKKLKSDTEKQKRQEFKARKEAVRPKSWYTKEAQKWFNKFVRLRDKGLPCISCGHPDNGSRQRHASHYRSTGSCSSLRFDELNVHASCSICNNHLSGNIARYTPELIKKIGKPEFERIERAPRVRKYDIEELKAIIKKYKAKCKALENES